MLSDEERRHLLSQVINDLVPKDVLVEWLDAERWSAQAKLTGSTGNVGFLLASPEWQEARFSKPRRSTFMIADGSDPDDVRRTLSRLAKAVAAYLVGDTEIERKRTLLGIRSTLVIHSADGPWRIGERTTQPPRFAD